ncbi:hypothetical protein [Streptomyces narbonensis]|uniref:hypothetical protein n=1 Tax=Streptomyces narbonensis TaxID=67333 RepID=UPI003405CC2E
MRVIGLTVTGARVDAHLGEPTDEEVQARVIRRWARTEGHAIQAIIDLRDSEWPVFNAFTTGAIQAVVLYTDALAAFEAPPPLSGGQIQRMRQARQKKHEEGGYAYGAPSFGWAAVGGRLALSVPPGSSSPSPTVEVRVS